MKSSKQAAGLAAKFAVVLLVLAGGTACTTIQSTAVSDIARGSGHRITAQDTGHGFLMVSVPELDAVVRLKAQCAGGITGIHTVTWVRNWFGLVQHYHQQTTGWCQPN